MSKVIIGSRDENSIPFVLCEATSRGYKLFKTESHELTDESPAASAASAVGSSTQDNSYLFRRLITNLDCPAKRESESEKNFLARISEEWGKLRETYSLTDYEQYQLSQKHKEALNKLPEPVKDFIKKGNIRIHITDDNDLMIDLGKLSHEDQQKLIQDDAVAWVSAIDIEKDKAEFCHEDKQLVTLLKKSIGHHPLLRLAINGEDFYVAVVRKVPEASVSSDIAASKKTWYRPYSLMVASAPIQFPWFSYANSLPGILYNPLELDLLPMFFKHDCQSDRIPEIIKAEQLDGASIARKMEVFNKALRDYGGKSSFSLAEFLLKERKMELRMRCEMPDLCNKELLEVIWESFLRQPGNTAELMFSDKFFQYMKAFLDADNFVVPKAYLRERNLFREDPMDPSKNWPEPHNARADLKVVKDFVNYPQLAQFIKGELFALARSFSDKPFVDLQRDIVDKAAQKFKQLEQLDAQGTYFRNYYIPWTKQNDSAAAGLENHYAANRYSRESSSFRGEARRLSAAVESDALAAKARGVDFDKDFELAKRIAAVRDEYRRAGQSTTSNNASSVRNQWFWTEGFMLVPEGTRAMGIAINNPAETAKYAGNAANTYFYHQFDRNTTTEIVSNDFRSKVMELNQLIGSTYPGVVALYWHQRIILVALEPKDEPKLELIYKHIFQEPMAWRAPYRRPTTLEIKENGHVNQVLSEATDNSAYVHKEYLMLQLSISATEAIKIFRKVLRGSSQPCRIDIEDSAKDVFVRYQKSNAFIPSGVGLQMIFRDPKSGQKVVPVGTRRIGAQSKVLSALLAGGRIEDFTGSLFEELAREISEENFGFVELIKKSDHKYAIKIKFKDGFEEFPVTINPTVNMESNCRASRCYITFTMNCDIDYEKVKQLTEITSPIADFWHHIGNFLHDARNKAPKDHDEFAGYWAGLKDKLDAIITASSARYDELSQFQKQSISFNLLPEGTTMRERLGAFFALDTKEQLQRTCEEVGAYSERPGLTLVELERLMDAARKAMRGTLPESLETTEGTPQPIDRILGLEAILSMDARANSPRSFFARNEVVEAQRQTASDSFDIRFKQLEEQLTEQMNRTPKVRSGFFAGQAPRNLREASQRIDMMRNGTMSYAQGLDAVISILGRHHPVAKAAETCQKLRFSGFSPVASF